MSELRAACWGRDLARDGWPTVSVVVPVRNEASHLEHAVTSILGQAYPVPFDVCLAVAPSTDGTEDVAARIAAHEPRVRVVPNPAGFTPAGLNAAIGATDGEIVVRVDGHSVLSDGYIERAVETMVRTGAVNVGGRQVPRPESPVEDAVAAATTSWLGTGGASYRVGGEPGPVDTVYLGVFDRVAGDQVGWFADDLIRNQDYELNIRLRAAGGTVWFDPDLWVGYRPRGTWSALARQYYEYGYWKAEVVRRHPGSLRLRQVLPAVVVPACVGSILGGRRLTPRRLVAPAYLTLVVAGSWDREPAAWGRRAAAVLVTHLAWSAGACVGAWSAATRRRRRSIRT